MLFNKFSETMGKKNEKVYVPNIDRSHPLRFIWMPFYIVLTFIFYWFVFWPLVSIELLEKLDIPHSVIFAFALLFFCVFLSIMVCFWRCKETTPLPEDYCIVKTVGCSKEDIELNYLHEYDTIVESKENDINEHTKPHITFEDEKLKTETKNTKPRVIIEHEKLKTESDHDVIVRKQKPRPKTFLDSGDGLHFKQRPISCVSTREEFFKSLLDLANSNLNNSVQKFIDEERKICQPKEECLTPREFFIADVQKCKVNVSEAFIFVDDVPKSNIRPFSVLMDVKDFEL